MNGGMSVDYDKLKILFYSKKKNCLVSKVFGLKKKNFRGFLAKIFSLSFSP